VSTRCFCQDPRGEFYHGKNIPLGDRVLRRRDLALGKVIVLLIADQALKFVNDPDGRVRV